MTIDPKRPVTEALPRFLSGAGLLFDGIGLLRAERSLWPLAAVPVLFSTLALAAALGVMVSNAAELRTWIDGLLPILTVSHWYEWIWIGPAQFLVASLACLIFLLIAAGVALIALLVASLISSPFLDRLSWRVERLVSGAVSESDESGLRSLSADVVRSLVAEAQRILFFVSIWIPLVAVGLLIPGAQLITGPLLVLLTIVLLPLQFCGYTLDRRRVSFKQRRAWLRHDLPTALGFGSAAFVACFVPGLNLVMIPGLVTAGTLLVVRQGPEAGL